ncbi:hypothetical protein Trydic_g13644 [Trypoxylus dichotomus]
MSISQGLADADHIREQQHHNQSLPRENKKSMDTTTSVTKADLPCIKGQINRKTSLRRKEHKPAVRAKQTTSTSAQDVLVTGHKIDFEKTITTNTSGHLPTRISREAIETEKRLHRDVDHITMRTSKTWRE